MKLKKREQNNQFTIWIVASILLHILILIIAFFWYMERSIQQKLEDSKQLHIPKQQKKPTTALKDLKVKEPPVYTLIPGSKAVTESKQKEPEKSKPIENKQIFPKEQPTRKHEILKQKSPIQKTIPPKHAEQDRLDIIKQQLLKPQEKVKYSEQKQNPDKTNDPTIQKTKVTLKDLKLGFAKYLNEGNNDILLQHSKSNQPPDAKALRLITFQQQIARTMRDAISSHNQYYLVKNVRGTRPTFYLSTDRNGKLLSFKLIQSSGNELFDKIIEDSLKHINLYPSIPKHLLDDTFSMNWVFLH